MILSTVTTSAQVLILVIKESGEKPLYGFERTFVGESLTRCKQMACLFSRQCQLLLHLIRVIKESGEKPTIWLRADICRRVPHSPLANGLVVLLSKPFASSLNPSHKGKGDSFMYVVGEKYVES